MSAWLLDFRLLTASGDVLECSRESHRDVFWATVGGMGLTGIILDARLKLKAVATAYMRADYERAANVDAVLTRIDETDDDYAYSVAWIDCLARGRSLGRSVLLRANHAAPDDLPARWRADPHRVPRRWEPTVPFVLPNFVLNPMSMRVFNALYYRGHGARRFVTDCNRYFYPLDSLHHWNRVFGPRGVIQYQALFPPESAREGLIELLEVIANAGSGSFLAVLKSMGNRATGSSASPGRERRSPSTSPTRGQTSSCCLQSWIGLSCATGAGSTSRKTPAFSRRSSRRCTPRCHNLRKSRPRWIPTSASPRLWRADSPSRHRCEADRAGSWGQFRNWRRRPPSPGRRGV